MDKNESFVTKRTKKNRCWWRKDELEIKKYIYIYDWKKTKREKDANFRTQLKIMYKKYIHKFLYLNYKLISNQKLIKPKCRSAEL